MDVTLCADAVDFSACQATSGETNVESGHAPAVRTSRYYPYLGCGGAGPVAGGPHGGAFYSTISLSPVSYGFIGDTGTEGVLSLPLSDPRTGAVYKSAIPPTYVVLEGKKKHS